MPETHTYHIYGLAHPETEQVHYVGHSRQVLVRYKAHVSNPRPDLAGARGHWIAELKAQELAPELVILETLEGTIDHCTEVPTDVFRREIFWISRLREAGHPLLNRLDSRHRKLLEEGSEDRILREAEERGRNLALSLFGEFGALLED